MDDLLKHLLPEWISLAIVLFGIWVSIGRNLVTKSEVEKMIQCLSPYNLDKQFIYERLDMNKEMQEQFADALQRNTEVMTDLKIQIATLSKTLETIERNNIKH
jgi:hypothetical protein